MIGLRAIRLPSAPRPLVALAPFAYLGLVALSWVAIDAIREVGPLDRAKLGGAIGLPLTLLIPTVTARAAVALGRGIERQLVVGGVAVLGALAVVGPMWIEYARRCGSVAMPVPAGALAIVGVAVAAALGLSTLVAMGLWPHRDGPKRSVAPAFVVSALVLALAATAVVLLAVQLLQLDPCVVRPSLTP